MTKGLQCRPLAFVKNKAARHKSRLSAKVKALSLSASAA